MSADDFSDGVFANAKIPGDPSAAATRFNFALPAHGEPPIVQFLHLGRLRRGGPAIRAHTFHGVRHNPFFGFEIALRGRRVNAGCVLHSLDFFGLCHGHSGLLQPAEAGRVALLDLHIDLLAADEFHRDSATVQRDDAGIAFARCRCFGWLIRRVCGHGSLSPVGRCRLDHHN
ncbi:MAG: hypothetical protein VB131_02535, partial [Burkholderia gladioli]